MTKKETLIKEEMQRHFHNILEITGRDNCSGTGKDVYFETIKFRSNIFGILESNERKIVLRKAEPRDIFYGNNIYLIVDDMEIVMRTIDSVIDPEEPHKAFSAKEDGCRYGLERAYVCEIKTTKS